MEIKDKPLIGKQDKLLVDGTEKTFSSLLKQRINNFLMVYFDYLALVLALIVLAVGLFFFVYPRYQQMIKSDETAKNKLQTEYDVRYSYLSSIRGLKDSYQLISEADRKKIADMVPVGNEVINLITEIESMAFRNGVILNSVKVEPVSGLSQAQINTQAGSGDGQGASAGTFEQLPEGVGQAKIDIDLSSVNYPVFKNLLKTFENNLRLLDVAKISYSVQENKAIFTVYAYYFIH